MLCVPGLALQSKENYGKKIVDVLSVKNLQQFLRMHAFQIFTDTC